MKLKRSEKYLIREGSLAASSLIDGLDCIKKASIYRKGLYYQAFLSFNTGLRRILKIIAIYKYRAINNSFPDDDYLKKIGNSTYEMVKNIYPELLENKINEHVVKYFDIFIKYTEFYNLNTVDELEDEEDVLYKWYEIEEEILKANNAYMNRITNFEASKKVEKGRTLFFHDEKGNLNSDISVFVTDIQRTNKVQGYNALTFYLIIKQLAKVLYDYEKEYNYFPKLSELFTHFLICYDNNDIRRKKHWKGIIVG